MWVFLWAGLLGHCLLELHPDPKIMNVCCEVERERGSAFVFGQRVFPCFCELLHRLGISKISPSATAEHESPRNLKWGF